jgi:LacI family transcriptional regulator
VNSAAEHIRAFDYKVHYCRIPDYDTEAYIHILKDEIKNGLSAAALVNQRIYDFRRILDVVEEAGIPYLLYNVDNPETNRRCYIGCDYEKGGRLSANFIGNSLMVKKRGSVLAIGIIERCDQYAVKPDINAERLKGFSAVMHTSYPLINCHIECLNAKSPVAVEEQIHSLLKEYEYVVDAVYFIPAFNTAFLSSLESFDYADTIIVIHDIDASSSHYLDTGCLSAVVYQDPILQGYSTVRAMEHILESKLSARQNDIEVVHQLIFKENLDLLCNHYRFNGETTEQF